MHFFFDLTCFKEVGQKYRNIYFTCPSGFSDFPPQAEINEMEEKSKDTLNENVEKGIPSLTITDFDQEKPQDQGPTSPSGFLMFPPLSTDNTRGKINEKEENSINIQKEIGTEITDCGKDQDIIQGWGPTSPSEFSDVPPLPANYTNTGVEINEMDEKSRDILEDNLEKEISYSTTGKSLSEALLFCRTWGEYVLYSNCFLHSEQFLYKTYSPLVLNLEFSCIELVIQ